MYKKKIPGSRIHLQISRTSTRFRKIFIDKLKTNVSYLPHPFTSFPTDEAKMRTIKSPKLTDFLFLTKIHSDYTLQRISKAKITKKGGKKNLYKN